MYVDDVFRAGICVHPILLHRCTTTYQHMYICMHSHRLRASELEQDVVAQKAVLRRGLELVPTSLKLWKAAIGLEDQDEARILLSRAVECVPPPDSLELWLALARLETYEQAQVVLNNARQAIPNQPIIWITAAKLDEANGRADRVEKLIKKAVKAMEAQHVVINRETWFKEAENAERTKSVATCQALIYATIDIGVEEQDRRKTWMADAEEFLSKSAIECARAVYTHLLTLFAASSALWKKFADLEKTHGTRETLDALLAKAVQHCPQDDTLWLMGAKEKWLAGDVPGARYILKMANAAIPDSENIWLAAAKLEYESNEPERARALLTKARERAGTERVWMKSIVLEREIGQFTDAAALCQTALTHYPDFWKLWLLATQVQPDQATMLFEKAKERCFKRPEVWCNAADHDLRIAGVATARATLEVARQKLPLNAQVWLKSIQIEADSGNLKTAQSLMAKALQACPSAGVLWAYAIELEPRAQRKGKIFDALKKCHDDANVFVASANLFWADRKVEKARDWFNRAVTVLPDWGDAWAHFYRFELQYGVAEQQQAIMKRCEDADPRHGVLWTRVSKAVGNARYTSVLFFFLSFFFFFFLFSVSQNLLLNSYGPGDIFLVLSG
jgi:pre-mRNA-processing factor 6